MDGLTGKVMFDTEGFRSNFNLEIIELRKEGLVQVNIENLFHNFQWIFFEKRNPQKIY